MCSQNIFIILAMWKCGEKLLLPIAQIKSYSGGYKTIFLDYSAKNAYHPFHFVMKYSKNYVIVLLDLKFGLSEYLEEYPIMVSNILELDLIRPAYSCLHTKQIPF